MHYQFAVTHADRDELLRHLAAQGIGSAVHYAPGLHRHPAFAGAAAQTLPITDRLADRLLSLPIQPEVAAPHLERIAAAVRGFCAGTR